MVIESNGLLPVAEVECQPLEVERGVTAVDRGMMVGANQYHVGERICPAPAQPLHVMAVAEILTVTTAGIP